MIRFLIVLLVAFVGMSVTGLVVFLVEWLQWNGGKCRTHGEVWQYSHYRDNGNVCLCAQTAKPWAPGEPCRGVFLFFPPRPA